MNSSLKIILVMAAVFFGMMLLTPKNEDKTQATPIQQEVVERVLQTKELRGIIFRTFGAGNAPQKKWLVDALKQATAEGKIIINITQCAGGSVHMERYETGLQLQEAGVTSGHDSTVEAAITKLMYLLGKDLPVEEVRRRMETNIAGEISV